MAGVNEEAKAGQKAGERRLVRAGRPPLTERRREAVRLEIARAAVDLFTDRGVEGVSASDIAAAVGISTRTLWRYFPSKEECVAPLLALGVQRLTRRLSEQPADEPLLEAVQHGDWLTGEGPDTARLVLDLMRLTRLEPGLQAVWMRQTYTAHPAVADVFAQRAGRDEASLEDDVQAAMLLSAMHVAVRDFAWSRSGKDYETLADALRYAATVAARGLPR
ncbi:TetR/AcrR family transcriptional regulator [Streptomyces sp. SID4956]|uniref:TetR family transcriptional regulator n=1 Tax=Streptomyces sp. SID4956 TaxID=2690290 RepID=UPI0013705408|nr:TetR family transcriptional regulator [Streptomyces sp. SID4956]